MALDPLQALIDAVSRDPSSIVLLASDRSTPVDELKDCETLSFPPNTAASSHSNGDPSRVLLHKTAPTRYKRDEHNFYDLGSLLFCFLRQDVGAGDYFRAAQEQGVMPLGIIERRAVVDLLQGKRPPGNEVAPLEAAPPAEAALAGAQQVRSTTPDYPPPDEAPGDFGVQERPAKKARYVPNKEDQELVRKLASFQENKQLSDRETALRGAKPVSFDHLKGLIGDRLNSARLEFQRGGAPDKSAAAGAPGKDRKKRPLQPIIIISPSASALITMHNVKYFLEDAQFVPTEQLLSKGHKVVDDTVPVHHRRQLGSNSTPSSSAKSGNPTSSSALGTSSSGAPDRAARYWVVDSVAALSKLGSSDVWDRVVCVMTTGQEWQFKPYKWSEPKELFHHVKGFHFHYSNEPPNPKIKQWNVTEMRLDPSRRHVDKSVVAEFWRVLEMWISANKPYLQW